MELVNCNLQNLDFVKIRNICHYKYYLCNYKLFGFVKLASDGVIDSPRFFIAFFLLQERVVGIYGTPPES